MPTYKITSPDGDTYEITAPDGATEADVLAYAQKNFKMAAKPKAKPAGQQLDAAIKDVPRQLGLTARAALQGVGGMADLVATPFRAALNAIPGVDIQPGMGQAAADLIGLPKPRAGLESTVGTAAEFVAGGVLPIAAGAKLASGASGVAQRVGQVMAANPAQQLASAGAGGLASGHVRETGGGPMAQTVAALGAGIAAPVAMNAAQRVGQGAAAGARRMMTRLPDQTQIDVTINTALQGGGGSMSGGYTLANLPDDVARGIREDVKEAMKIGGNLKPDAIRRLADYRMLGVTPNRAGLTLDPGDITRQKNLAKLGANSKDPAAQGLSQMENANNARLTQVLNQMGAATPDDQIAGASKVINALDMRNDRAQGLIKQRYDNARTSAGRSAELDPEYFVNTANAKLNEAMLGDKVPESVRNILNKEWIDVMRMPPGPEMVGPAAPKRFTVDMAEQMKTSIAQRQRASTDPAERMALGMVRSALDDTPLMPGQQMGEEAMKAFTKARDLNRRWMGIVERTPALEAVRDGVEPDKFVQQFIVGNGSKASVMDVAKLKASIKSDPDALQAVREQIAADLKRSAKSGAEDEIVNFSQSAYNKRLKAIGERKLALFFKPDEIEKLKAVGRVASYEQAQPVGSAVNNSNTASAGFTAIIDRIVDSPLIGKIPFGQQMVREPLQNIILGSQVNRTLSAPRALTDGAGLQLPQRPLTRGVSPSLLMESDTEEARQRRGLLDF
ncbi:MAG TPA: hypothetical protein VGE56_04830 [Rhodocyclaceae bacterium]